MSSYQCKRHDLPEYKGDNRFWSYPMFKKEWTRNVAPGRSVDRQVTMLNKQTPEIINRKMCGTVSECWRRLDSKYASRMAISNELVEEFRR